MPFHFVFQVCGVNTGFVRACTLCPTENPNPSRGDRQLIVLSQSEQVEMINEKKTHVSVEIVFELNYSTGQWRRLQRKKMISRDPTAPAGLVPSIPSQTK